MYMKKYNLQIICFSLFIITGIFLASVFYQQSTYSVESGISHLKSIEDSSNPIEIRYHLVSLQERLDVIMEKIPETTNRRGDIIAKNPVWLFPTESTNFLKIQNNVNTMITNIEEISYIPKDTSAYYTGMLDINHRAELMRFNLTDTFPYLYMTPEYFFSNSIFLIGIIGMVEILNRKSPSIR